MSNTSWTKEQMDAISESGCNLLVAAAAGAGKTAVLVERIIRKITDKQNPVDLDRLLIVTFTNAAAGEMRERIGDAIAKALDNNPESKILQRQASLLHKANITTIHSFCLDVIKSNFYSIDIDPVFRIADQTEAQLMKMDVLEELLVERYQCADDDVFLELVECYGGKKDDNLLQDMVLTFFDFIQSHPWPEDWLDKNTELFNLPPRMDFGSTEWAKTIIDCIKSEMCGLLSIMNKAVDIVQHCDELHPYLSCFYNDIQNITGLLNLFQDNGTFVPGYWDSLYKAFSNIKFDTLSRCGKDVDKRRQDRVKAMRNKVKEGLRKIRDDIFLSDSAGIIGDLNMLYPLLRCLSGLVKEFGEKYSEKKREKAVVDFNDLEHFCLKILAKKSEPDITNDNEDTDVDSIINPTDIALQYRDRFEEIMVDEYQDSNMTQEVILSIISRKDSEKPNMFMVGDVKQSIYRFRQARPEIFLDKYNTYADIEGFKNRKVLLYKNFRSREEIIDGVNFLFKHLMSKKVGEIDYGENEALQSGAVYEPLEQNDAIAGGAVELNIIDMKDNFSDRKDEQYVSDDNNSGETSDFVGDNEEYPDRVSAEAGVVIRRIKELIYPLEGKSKFKVYDRSISGYREIQYRDIVILLRTTRNWSEVFMEQLDMHGIPAYADTGEGFFKTVEVQTIMSLLQIIDNPMQDIPMLSVMYSPIISFSAQQLIDIRAGNEKMPFYEAIKKVVSETNDDTAQKAESFLKNLEGWRNRAVNMSTDQLIWYLYNDTGYYSFAGAMPGGVRRQANLRMLYERARLYEKTSYRGLFNFINYINKLISRKGDMGSAKTMSENENVVRIMSIHKSKGLEFPVVIVSGCGKRFNFQDMNKSILIHQDMGFGPEFVDYRKRISYPTLPKQALKYKMKLETLSEEMRIMYVAFTRAREKLIITGCVRNVEKAAMGWYDSCIQDGDKKIPEHKVISGRNYLDWIVPVVMNHNDGCVLRQLAGGEEEAYSVIENNSRWDVMLWDKRDLTMKENVDSKYQQYDISETMGDTDESEEYCFYSDEIKRRLEWKYPYEILGKLPAKLSVTELKRHFNYEISEEYSPLETYAVPVIKKPGFLEEKRELSGAEKGTIVHFVMQHLDLQRVSSIDSIQLQISEMVTAGLVMEHQSKVVDTSKIKEFFSCPVGLRMLNSGKVYREVPFNMELNSTEIRRDLPEDIYGSETIVVQGVIDCFFEEDGEVVLLDYKTDYVVKNEVGAIKDKYRTQIEYYSKALERMYGKRVKEKFIYLFWNGYTIKY